MNARSFFKAFALSIAALVFAGSAFAQTATSIILPGKYDISYRNDLTNYTKLNAVAVTINEDGTGIFSRYDGNVCQKGERKLTQKIMTSGDLLVVIHPKGIQSCEPAHLLVKKTEDGFKTQDMIGFDYATETYTSLASLIGSWKKK